MNKRIRMLSIFMVMSLVFISLLSGGISVTNAKAATKSKVLIAYLGRYDNTNFKKM